MQFCQIASRHRGNADVIADAALFPVNANVRPEFGITTLVQQLTLLVPPIRNSVCVKQRGNQTEQQRTTRDRIWYCVQ